jgi:hypothetical protein
VALLVAFAAAGGMAAASSSVRSAFTNVARVVHIAAPTRQASPNSALTPAVDQYGRKKSCVKAAVARRNAAFKAANARLKRELKFAKAHYLKSLAKANKRYTASAKTRVDTAKHVAAVKAARGKYKLARAAAWKKHGRSVKAALARYKRDLKKCPIV